MLHRIPGVLCVVLLAGCSAAVAQWNMQHFGDGLLTFPFDVKVGNARNDGTNRVYVSERNGRVLEWTYAGTGWVNKVVASSVTNLALLAIGAVRGDGTNRIYYTEYRPTGALHEVQWNGSAWASGIVDNTHNAYCIFIGAGRNDGVPRLYAGTHGDASHVGQGLWEYTYTTGAWSKVCLHTNGMDSSGAVAALRNDGTNRVLANSSVLDEMTWNGSTYTTSAIDHTAGLTPDPTTVGKLRNDGRTCVLINSQTGKCEYVYNAGAWARTTVDATVQRGDVFVARLQADGLYRAYVTYTGNVLPKGPVREFTWNPATSSYTTSVVVDATTGATAKLAAGNGRNDGVARLYTPDYAGGRLLEITSTNAFLYAVPRTDLAIVGLAVTNGTVVLVITNLTATCDYAVERALDLLQGWSTDQVFTAVAPVTNWGETNGLDRAFYHVLGQPNTP